MIGFGRARRPAAPARRPPGEQAVLDQVIGVRALDGPILERTDGTFATILEVAGEPFGLMDGPEQDARVEALAAVLNTLDAGQGLQITRWTEPGQLEGVLADLAAARDRWGDHPLGHLAEATRQMAAALAGGILAQTCLWTVTARSREAVQDQADRLLAALTQRQFRAQRLEAERVGQILQWGVGRDPVDLAAVLGGSVLGAVTRAAPGAASEPAAEAAEAEPDLAAYRTRLADLLRPAAWIEQPGLLDLGGVFARSFAVVAYPEQARNGWMDAIATFAAPEVWTRVTWHLQAWSTGRALAQINRHLRLMDANARWTLQRGMRPDMDTERGIEGAEILRQDLARGLQKLFAVRCLVTLLSRSPEALRQAAARLQDAAAGAQIAILPTYLAEGPAFQSTLPVGRYALHPAVEHDAAERALPTLVLATMFPLPGGEYADPHGDLWGVNLDTGNAVVVDPRGVDPGHLVVVAPTGSGKTFALKTLATQALIRGDEDVIVIDPSPPIDYERWAWLVGASYIRLGPGSPDRINPLEILWPADLAAVREEVPRPLSAKVAFATTLVGLLAYPEGALPPEARARLDTLLLDLYAARGMADDWAAIRDPDAPTLTPVARPSPTLADLLAALDRDPALAELALRLRPYVQGSLALFAGATTVDLGNRAVVLNVAAFNRPGGEHVQAAAYAVLADFLFWRLASARRRVLILIDEAHVLFRRADTARLVSQLFRMARKQGGRVALITQSMIDLLGDPATGLTVPGQADAKACLDNAKLRLFLKNDQDHDVDLIRRTFGLTAVEARMIREAAAKGQGVLLAAPRSGRSRRVVLRIQAPDALYPWITSDPEEVRQFQAAGVYRAMEAAPDAVPVAPDPAPEAVTVDA